MSIIKLLSLDTWLNLLGRTFYTFGGGITIYLNFAGDKVLCEGIWLLCLTGASDDSIWVVGGGGGCCIWEIVLTSFI